MNLTHPFPILLRLYEAGFGTARAKAVGLLTYLLVEKCDHFRPNLKYLLFLPNYKDLDAVNASIRSACRLPPHAAELRDLLRFLIHSTDHDSAEVSFTIN